MISLLDGDELVALRFAPGVPVIADETYRAVDGVRTAQREVDVVQVTGSPLCQFRRQPDRRLRAKAEIARCVGKLTHLPGSGRNDALVPIAGIDAPEPGEAVNELVS